MHLDCVPLHRHARPSLGHAALPWQAKSIWVKGTGQKFSKTKAYSWEKNPKPVKCISIILWKWHDFRREEWQPGTWKTSQRITGNFKSTVHIKQVCPTLCFWIVISAPDLLFEWPLLKQLWNALLCQAANWIWLNWTTSSDIVRSQNQPWTFHQKTFWTNYAICTDQRP